MVNKSIVLFVEGKDKLFSKNVTTLSLPTLVREPGDLRTGPDFAIVPSNERILCAKSCSCFTRVLLSIGGKDRIFEKYHNSLFTNFGSIAWSTSERTRFYYCFLKLKNALCPKLRNYCTLCFSHDKPKVLQNYNCYFLKRRYLKNMCFMKNERHKNCLH